MYQSAILTVDVVLLSIRLRRLCVALVNRDQDPFRGTLALPGGYVHTNEDKDDMASALRTLKVKANIKAPYLEQLKTFASENRDPRGWSASIAYFALVREDDIPSDSKVIWLPVDELPQLAFDHNEIVMEGVKRLCSKSSYSSMPCYLLGHSFTLTEMQDLYEQLLQETWKPSAFRRKMGITANGVDPNSFLEEVEGAKRLGNHRPASLYRLKDSCGLAVFQRAMA